MDLSGRYALVTGGSRHLGAAIAFALARRGATIAVNYHRSAGGADEVIRRLRSIADGDHVAVQGDVAVASDVERVVATTKERFGRIDVLVNNAGPYVVTPLTRLPEADWDRIWDTNVKSIYLCVRAVAPGMQEAGWGRVVNLSAVSAQVRNRSIYGLAKAATEVITEELAAELGPAVTVNAVAPGQIAESLEELAETEREWAARVVRRTPLGRLVRRREVAELVALLCTPAFDLVTGATIPVDGGLRLPRF